MYDGGSIPSIGVISKVIPVNIFLDMEPVFLRQMLPVVARRCVREKNWWYT